MADGPWLWNSFPAGLRQSDVGYEQFKQLQKTYVAKDFFGRWDRVALWLYLFQLHFPKFSYLLTYLHYIPYNNKFYLIKTHLNFASSLINDHQVIFISILFFFFLADVMSHCYCSSFTIPSIFKAYVLFCTLSRHRYFYTETNKSDRYPFKLCFSWTKLHFSSTI